MISSEEYRYLLTVDAIRDRANQVFQLALANKTHFDVHLDKLDAVAELTLKIMKENYPDDRIPLHSRWRHFVVKGSDRAQFLATLPAEQRVKAALDLAMVSVLLDAGAGADWVYRDQQGHTLTRSEGLAIASLELFAAGLFSADKNQPWRVDGEILKRFTLEKLISGLQVNANNPLIGLEGRCRLLQHFGRLLIENRRLFPDGRPGSLYDYLKRTFADTLTAGELVNLLLSELSPIWGRVVDNYPLGDVWRYSPVGWIPFHKLTLWLTLSLIEPLQAAGLRIRNLEQLPGLAEYRNGGLFMDGGVLTVRDRALLAVVHRPSDPLIVEWRALTIVLLENLAALIRQKKAMDSSTLPLVTILQGGTGQAGRQLALQRSPAGDPPLRYLSSGTIF